MNNPSLENNEGGQASDDRGIFIIIEGTDGSGKSTQYEKMRQHLLDEGHEIVTIHFPRYKEDSSYFVREYLGGNYGTADEVGPYTGSLFYALDRYQAARDIRQALSEGKVVLCDRYVGSNMAHQGTKFDNAEERRGYFIWLDNLEFQMLGIPRPDINFVLRTPYEVIKERLAAKESSSTHIKKDIHEIDEGHIQKSIDAYDDLCQLFPKDFQRIDSARGEKILDIETIHKMMWEKISPMLKPKKQSNNTEEYIMKTGNGFTITPRGKDYLDKAVTNSTGNVYAFTEELSPVTIAAAMARLSRRGDDMRITLLDEFASAQGKDASLLKRVISAYGDDSVQQLAGLHVVVENASNLLTKKLEWGRLASYLEQSTRYIYFDQKDKDGKYRYHVPEHFNPETKQIYIESMDILFKLYSELVHKITDYVRKQSDVPEKERDIAWKGATRAQACDAARPVLPVATTSTVGIYASGQALESLIIHLQSDEINEAKKVGEEILVEARKVIPAFLERADKPDRGGATVAYRATTADSVKQLADEVLPVHHSSTQEPVTLTSYWPRNELDLVPDMLYEHSSLSLEQIAHEVDNLTYEKRLEIFGAYMGERLNRRHRPGRAMEKAHYSWDLVCDYGIFRDLQRHRIVDDLEWQLLTPRYGYEIPQLIEDAGMTDIFEQCFDISLSLYSTLQASGYSLDAQYATLLGHRMRWKVTYNAREAFHLHELRTTPQGHPGYRKLVKAMHEKVREVHPLIADAMIFVNKDEDPALTRLAAERYTQYKLNQLK